MGYGCAAITLDRRGGGVALASQVIWRAMHERWGADARLVTLIDEQAHGAVLPTPGLLPRLRFGTRLAEMQASGSCRWILCTHVATALAQSYVPGPLRQPYAVFLHGVEAWGGLTARHRRVLQSATVLLTNSSYTARRVIARHPWIRSITPCGLALPEEPSKPNAGRRSSPGDGPRRVLVVGRMDAAEQYKGHDQLLEAWPAVRREVRDASLVVAGTGDDAERLRAKATALGIGESVQFTGFVSDPQLADLYSQSLVFAMPSRNEGFGLVYLEAMSYGLPCIGSVHDAAGEVIDDGVTGYLVDQAATVSLAARLIRLLTDDALRANMGAAGHRRLEQRFSYDRFRNRLHSVLDNAFGGTESSAA